MKKLHRISGFLPLIGMLFINNFIDLGHKIIIQNTIFKLYNGSEQIILTAIVNGLILLPNIFFFYSAGHVADKYAKTTVLRIAAIAAVVITICISVCYWQSWFWAAFALTFVLAVQSAYYGPAKYGLLKELVSNQQLSAANGIAQAISIVGILSGLLCFSIFYEMRFEATAITENAIIRSMAPLSFILIACSILECALAWQLPHIQAHPLQTEKTTAQQWLRSPILFPAIIGISVFWSVGQMLIATYPAFAKTEMGVTNTIVIQGLLATIAIGIMAGSFIAGRFSRTHIETALIPVGSAGIILTTLLLPFVTSLLPATLVFFIIGVFGGIYIVPLNAIIQYCAPPRELGAILANNILTQNIFMTTCLVVTVMAALIDINAKQLLFLIALVSLVGSIIVIIKLPYVLLRFSKKRKKSLKIEGFNHSIGYGAMFINCPTLSSSQQELLQIAYPRKIVFTEPLQWDINTSYCGVMSDEKKAALENYVNVINVTIEENENEIRLVFSPH